MLELAKAAASFGRRPTGTHPGKMARRASRYQKSSSSPFASVIFQALGLVRLPITERLGSNPHSLTHFLFFLTCPISSRVEEYRLSQLPVFCSHEDSRPSSAQRDLCRHHRSSFIGGACRAAIAYKATSSEAILVGVAWSCRVLRR